MNNDQTLHRLQMLAAFEELILSAYGSARRQRAERNAATRRRQMNEAIDDRDQEELDHLTSEMAKINRRPGA